MAIRDEKDLINERLMDVGLSLMAMAARTAPTFGNRKSAIIRSIDSEELEKIAAALEEGKDQLPLLRREYQNVRDHARSGGKALLVGGNRKSDLNYNCGSCGFRTCAELNRAESPLESSFVGSKGPFCTWKGMDVGIACMAASAIAHRLGFQTREYGTVGGVALAMGMIEADSCTAITITVTDKNLHFTRNQYWTQEEYQKGFDAMFPSFNFGFITEGLK